jgi:hypothetical protein
MATREEKIARLTDPQALSVVASLAGEFLDAEAPEGRDAQTEALQALLTREGQAVDVSRAADADPAAAAAAARQLLSLMAQVPEMQPSLDEWLDRPPTQEAAALPLVLSAPIVLTGCITLLQVAGHLRFKRHPNGKWEWVYDPATETPLDKTMKGIVDTLAKLMRRMTPVG